MCFYSEYERISDAVADGEAVWIDQEDRERLFAVLGAEYVEREVDEYGEGEWYSYDKEIVAAMKRWSEPVMLHA